MAHKRITCAILRENGATCSHLDTFRAAWPDGVVPSARAAAKAARIGLDCDWFVRTLYPSLDAAYEEQCRPLDVAYRAQHRSLYASYEAQRYASYEAQHKSLNDAYEAQKWRLAWRLIKERK